MGGLGLGEHPLADDAAVCAVKVLRSLVGRYRPGCQSAADAGSVSERAGSPIVGHVKGEAVREDDARFRRVRLRVIFALAARRTDGHFHLARVGAP